MSERLEMEAADMAPLSQCTCCKHERGHVNCAQVDCIKCEDCEDMDRCRGCGNVVEGCAGECEDCFGVSK